MLVPEESNVPQLGGRTRSLSAIGVPSLDLPLLARAGSFSINLGLRREQALGVDAAGQLLEPRADELAAENADPNLDAMIIHRKSVCLGPVLPVTGHSSVDLEGKDLELVVQAVVDGSVEESDDVCFICLMEFSDCNEPGEERIILPCSAKCNASPVHARCIYEWKQRRDNPKGVGTCPLCREPLVEDAFTPLDMLESAKFVMWAERKSFVTKPLPPANDPVRCFVRVVHSMWTGLPIMYELYLQAPSTLSYPLGPLPGSNSPLPGDQLLLSAKKKWTSVGSSRFHISLDRSCKDYDSHSPNHVAAVSR